MSPNTALFMFKKVKICMLEYTKVHIFRNPFCKNKCWNTFRTNPRIIVRTPICRNLSLRPRAELAVGTWIRSGPVGAQGVFRYSGVVPYQYFFIYLNYLCSLSC